MTFSDFRVLNAAQGRFFFSRGAMRHFNSVIYGNTWNCKDGYFITGETSDPVKYARRYTIRHGDMVTGEVKTTEFQRFRSIEDARDTLKELRQAALVTV